MMSKDQTIRVGIIGADTRASWAQYSHVPAIEGLPDFQLAAVATRSADSAREAAEAFGAERWFDDAMTMITSDAVDLVTVAVRVPAHRDLVVAAIAAGKAVYCESPLGRDVAEAEEMAQVARAAGVSTAIGLQARYNPSLRRAAEVIARDEIGRPLTARIVSTSMGFGPASPASHDYSNKAVSGANLSTISAAHTLDAMEAVLGPIVEVDARSAILFPNVKLVDTGEISRRETADQLTVLGLAGKGCTFVADINGGIAEEDATFVMEVRGTDGWLKLVGGSPFGFQAADLVLTSSASFEQPETASAGSTAPLPAINVGEAYAVLARDMRDGTVTVAGFDHALRNSRLIEAVTEAARTGSRRKVPAA